MLLDCEVWGLGWGVGWLKTLKPSHHLGWAWVGAWPKGREFKAGRGAGLTR
ncbi:hypothetical protein HanIR_Chr17g0869791 [Helianthus annuus]|nr:hypothetical protein HanIR_Chr17g0869791 [Helianthus annuus]